MKLYLNRLMSIFFMLLLNWLCADACWFYTPCSVSCGGGVQYKGYDPLVRECAVRRGKRDVISCNTHPCPAPTNPPCTPKHCSWYGWGSWGSCSRLCGGGTQTRFRANSGQACGGSACSGTSVETRSCNHGCCPAHCSWGQWGSWGLCQKTCGGGVQSRYRGFASNAYCGGNACSGPKTEHRSCNQQCCPVNCAWSSWSSWGSCSVSCGGGTQSRSRAHATKLSCGGYACSGSTTQSRSCNKHCCAVNCKWAAWSAWGLCSKTCGGGTQSRDRKYATISSCNGDECVGKPSEARVCNEQCCPVDCSWSAWSNWGTCSHTCGGGRKSRSREHATVASCAGKSCPGLPLESESCNENCCPVDCAWSSWRSWGQCSESCGGGIQTRERTYAPPSSCGGYVCSGLPSQTQSCNQNCCKVDCKWAAWSSWSSCSATCGGGSQLRHRIYAKPSSCNGNVCVGSPSETRLCNVECCPVDCLWTAWSNWGSCSQTCGEGMKYRNRVYSIPALCGGKECVGHSLDSNSCNDNCCPIHCEWSNWIVWSACSVTCGGGITVRNRTKKQAASCGGNECKGPQSDEQACNSQCCPVNCAWKEWNAWTSCTKSCGGGSRRRYRTVAVHSTCGGTPCYGPQSENHDCNSHCCSVDCAWESWSTWGACTKTCGKGLQSRHRNVSTEALCGGQSCTGAATDTRYCNDVCCPVPCQWNQWSTWTACSESCGTGLQFRHRTVAVKESCGGGKCKGSILDTKVCNAQCCPVNCEMTPWSKWSECTHTCGMNGTQKRHRAIKKHPSCGGEECELDHEIKDCNRFCFNSATYTNNTCQCSNGWEGLCCDKDIDECALGNHNCTGHKQICVNYDGGYSCQCPDGLSLVGGKCKEPLSNPVTFPDDLGFVHVNSTIGHTTAIDHSTSAGSKNAIFSREILFLSTVLWHFI